MFDFFKVSFRRKKIDLDFFIFTFHFYYFFSLNKKVFSCFFAFVLFYHIKCPTHASGNVQLPLCRMWAQQTHTRKPEKS